MAKQDILFKTKHGVFSYRVAGVLIRDGKVLLQRPLNDPGYAYPGGHVSFGETSEETLIREFKEEIAADVKVERLLWIGENFFPWGENRCHQISLYYLVSLTDETQIPLDRSFFAHDELQGERCDLEFCWIEIASLEKITVYPAETKEKLRNLSDHIEQFVYYQ